MSDLDRIDLDPEFFGMCPICGDALLAVETLVDRNGETYHEECWEEENGPPDDPDAWSGGFAENH